MKKKSAERTQATMHREQIRHKTDMLSDAMQQAYNKRQDNVHEVNKKSADRARNKKKIKINNTVLWPHLKGNCVFLARNHHWRSVAIAKISQYALTHGAQPAQIEKKAPKHSNRLTACEKHLTKR